MEWLHSKPWWILRIHMAIPVARAYFCTRRTKATFFQKHCQAFFIRGLQCQACIYFEICFFKQCQDLPHFAPLWKTIRGGGFAGNTLLLGITPLHHSASKTVNADLTCLAILFGGEFINGISQSTGKAFIGWLMKDKLSHFYLQQKTKNGKIFLYYQFDVRKIIGTEVLGNFK